MSPAQQANIALIRMVPRFMETEITKTIEDIF